MTQAQSTNALSFLMSCHYPVIICIKPTVERQIVKNAASHCVLVRVGAATLSLARFADGSSALVVTPSTHLSNLLDTSIWTESRHTLAADAEAILECLALAIGIVEFCSLSTSVQFLLDSCFFLLFFLIRFNVHEGCPACPC
jgi:hypothetical protein